MLGKTLVVPKHFRIGRLHIIEVWSPSKSGMGSCIAAVALGNLLLESVSSFLHCFEHLLNILTWHGAFISSETRYYGTVDGE